MNGKFVAEQDAFSVSFSCCAFHYCLKFRRTRSWSRRLKTDLRDNQSDRSFRTSKPYQPIRSFLTDYEAVQANHIVYLRTTKPCTPIRLFLTDYEAVQANQIVPYRLWSRTSQSYCSLWTTNPYKPIEFFRQDSKAVPANQIVPYGLWICTSQSDRSRLLGRSPARSSEKIKSLAWSYITRVTKPEEVSERIKSSHNPRSNEWRTQKSFS